MTGKPSSKPRKKDLALDELLRQRPDLSDWAISRTLKIPQETVRVRRAALNEAREVPAPSTSLRQRSDPESLPRIPGLHIPRDIGSYARQKNTLRRLAPFMAQIRADLANCPPGDPAEAEAANALIDFIMPYLDGPFEEEMQRLYLQWTCLRDEDTPAVEEEARLDGVSARTWIFRTALKKIKQYALAWIAPLAGKKKPPAPPEVAAKIQELRQRSTGKTVTASKADEIFGIPKRTFRRWGVKDQRPPRPPQHKAKKDTRDNLYYLSEVIDTILEHTRMRSVITPAVLQRLETYLTQQS